MANVNWQAYEEALKRFQLEQEQAIRSETGWLSVDALHWLEKPDLRCTSDDSADIRLPAGAGRGDCLLIKRAGAELTLTSSNGTPLRYAGGTAHTVQVRAAAVGASDPIWIGNVLVEFLEREGRVAMRVRDPARPARKTFAGRRWFPANRDLVLSGRYIPTVAGEPIEVPNALGGVDRFPSPGHVEFTVNGVACSLRAVTSSVHSPTLLFVFRDQTSGKETYGGGRFLSTPRPQAAGELPLDFNRAVSPPCGFTPYAPCPLPPAGNALTVPITAGEMTPPTAY